MPRSRSNKHAQANHGRRGRIEIRSEWNTDREPPSRQVWVFLRHKGKEVGSSSVALVEDMGRVDLFGSPSIEAIPKDYEQLTTDELAFVATMSELWEGAKE